MNDSRGYLTYTFIASYTTMLSIVSIMLTVWIVWIIMITMVTNHAVYYTNVIQFKSGKN